MQYGGYCNKSSVVIVLQRRIVMCLFLKVLTVFTICEGE